MQGLYRMSGSRGSRRSRGSRGDVDVSHYQETDRACDNYVTLRVLLRVMVWNTEEWRKKSMSGKDNRSKTDGSGKISRHTGGSIGYDERSLILFAILVFVSYYWWQEVSIFLKDKDELLVKITSTDVDGLGGLGATVVNALDTAMIMKLDGVVYEADSWIENHLPERISHKGSPSSGEFSGGVLLAWNAHTCSHQRHYQDNGRDLLTFEDLENLKLAEDLAKTYFEMYAVTSTGLAPEIAYFSFEVYMVLFAMLM
ncbi:hypothetical protein R6Q59_017143 [Mikania micrantha]